jgi:hypothetical protein
MAFIYLGEKDSPPLITIEVPDDRARDARELLQIAFGGCPITWDLGAQAGVLLTMRGIDATVLGSPPATSPVGKPCVIEREPPDLAGRAAWLSREILYRLGGLSAVVPAGPLRDHVDRVTNHALVLAEEIYHYHTDVRLAPWVPTDDELGKFKQDLDAALAERGWAPKSVFVDPEAAPPEE